MRVAFAGGDAFAVPALMALHAAPGMHLDWVAAIPDRPAGRGMRVRPGPVPTACGQLGLACHQPADDAQLAALLEARPVDFLVTCAYGRKLGPRTLAAPRRACVNIHASLLPRWRGAAPIERALLAGDTRTGVTTMLMAARIDAGAILQQRDLALPVDATAGMVRDLLAHAGAGLITGTLADFAAITPRPQDPALVTRAPKLAKAEARLDWTLPATTLERQVRAFNPAPGAFTFIADERVKVLAARVVPSPAHQPGILLGLPDGCPRLACGTDALALLEVQPAGKRAMPARDWANGQHGRLVPGTTRAGLRDTMPASRPRSSAG